MDFLRFIFDLGVIYIIFDLIWKVFLFLVRITLGIDDHHSTPHFLFKGFGYYLLVSLTASTATRYMETAMSMGGVILYSVIGLMVLYFYITSRMQRMKRRARVRMDTMAVKRMRYNSLFLFLSLLLYVVCMYYPVLTRNMITDWLFASIEDVYEVMLFRWIIGFFAAIFLINILIKSVLTTQYLVFALIGRPLGMSNSTQATHFPGEDVTVDAEFEEVEEEELPPPA